MTEIDVQSPLSKSQIFGVIVAACVLSLLIVTILLIYCFIYAPAVTITISSADDYIERMLDASIQVTSNDFYMWHKINVLTQCLAVVLGISATILTASATSTTTQRLKLITVAVTAAATALITVQTTFHLRDNMFADATAYNDLVQIESKYTYNKHHLLEGHSLDELQKEVDQQVARNRTDRMIALASIGSSDRALKNAGGTGQTETKAQQREKEDQGGR